jgi:hypothetical protein
MLLSAMFKTVNWICGKLMGLDYSLEEVQELNLILTIFARAAEIVMAPSSPRAFLDTSKLVSISCVYSFTQH